MTYHVEGINGAQLKLGDVLRGEDGKYWKFVEQVEIGPADYRLCIMRNLKTGEVAEIEVREDDEYDRVEPCEIGTLTAEEIGII